MPAMSHSTRLLMLPRPDEEETSVTCLGVAQAGWWGRGGGCWEPEELTVGAYLAESFSRPSPAAPHGQICRPSLPSAICQSPRDLWPSHKVQLQL